jgi:phage-related minor tail protein
MRLFNMTVRRSPLAFLAIMLGVTAERMGMVEKAMEELKQKFPEFFEVVADVGEATAKLIRETYEALQNAMNTRLLKPEESFAKTEKGIDKITSATNRLSDAQLRLQSISQCVESSFENAFMSMLDGATSAKDAFRAMARDIIKELYRIFFVKRITGFISQAMDLYFGGPLVGFSGGIGDGRPAPDIPKRARGGPVSAGSPYLVGERGPELMIPNRSGTIIPNDKLGGGTVVVNQTINISTGVQQTVRAEIRQLMPQIADSAKAAVSDAKRRGGSYGRAFA